VKQGPDPILDSGGKNPKTVRFVLCENKSVAVSKIYKHPIVGEVLSRWRDSFFNFINNGQANKVLYQMVVSTLICLYMAMHTFFADSAVGAGMEIRGSVVV
jgi:hypothetical protein